MCIKCCCTCLNRTVFLYYFFGGGKDGNVFFFPLAVSCEGPHDMIWGVAVVEAVETMQVGFLVEDRYVCM